MKLKVCGITTHSQVQELIAMGIDYAGFIFYKKSPRYVIGKLNPATLKQQKGIQKVGVFVNEQQENIHHFVSSFGLDAVQLHGEETPVFCKALKEITTVIKAFSITGNEGLAQLTAPYDGSVDYFLFDTKTPQHGGSGKKFDWDIFESQKLIKPFFLSGGIGPADAPEIEKIDNKNLFAIDINSKFETEPGVKDMQLVKSFLQQIKHKA